MAGYQGTGQNEAGEVDMMLWSLRALEFMVGDSNHRLLGQAETF